MYPELHLVELQVSCDGGVLEKLGHSIIARRLDIQLILQSPTLWLVLRYSSLLRFVLSTPGIYVFVLSTADQA